MRNPIVVPALEFGDVIDIAKPLRGDPGYGIEHPDLRRVGGVEAASTGKASDEVDDCDMADMHAVRTLGGGFGDNDLAAGRVGVVDVIAREALGTPIVVYGRKCKHGAIAKVAELAIEGDEVGALRFGEFVVGEDLIIRLDGSAMGSLA